MFYFRTIKIKNTSPELVEKAIRHYTKMRKSYLDLLITSGELHDGMVFSGLEKKDSLLITPMKDLRPTNIWGDDRPWTPKYAPSVFIRFNKADNFTSYQLRFGFIAMLFFTLISFGFAFEVWQLLHNHFDLGLLFVTSLFLLVFLLRTNSEINKTNGAINKVIQITSTDNQQ